MTLTLYIRQFLVGFSDDVVPYVVFSDVSM